MIVGKRSLVVHFSFLSSSTGFREYFELLELRVIKMDFMLCKLLKYSFCNGFEEEQLFLLL